MGLRIHIVDALSRFLVILSFTAADQALWERVLVDIVLVIQLRHREAADTLSR